jgi:putative Ca2+/H+ antiporter (TMEM165/GDT1 family)
MTLLSAAAGFALPSLIPRTYTHYASVVLFFVFGFKLLKDATDMADGGGPSEELEEVEAELNLADKKKNPDIESGEQTLCERTVVFKSSAEFVRISLCTAR